MALIITNRSRLTLRYWKASLAWKNVGNWSRGWTQGGFITELKTICNDNGLLGSLADALLDDMVHDRERVEKPTIGELVELHAIKTSIIGHLNNTAVTAQR